MIIIKTIPHQDQRYNTIGDYQNYSERDTLITVSELNNPKYEFLVAVHELVEQFLCKQRGIALETIDTFDKNYETTREMDNYDEPGNHSEAPYHKEHMFATGIERLIASELGVDWKKYEETIDSIYLPGKSAPFVECPDDQC